MGKKQPARRASPKWGGLIRMAFNVAAKGWGGSLANQEV